MKLISAFIVIILLLNGPECVYASENNAQLTTLFKADQSERKAENIDWVLTNKHDEERRKITKKLLQLGQIQTASDYYHAALIFQHGLTYEEIQLANALTVIGLTIEPQNKNLKPARCPKSSKQKARHNAAQKHRR